MALLGNPDWGAGYPNPIPAGRAWIEQPVRVPDTAAPRLNFWYRILSYDIMGGTERVWDRLDVTVNGESSVVFRDGSRRSPGQQGILDDLGWKQGEVDLSRYRGQSVTLRFANWNQEYEPLDGFDLYNTWTYLDEVEVQP